MCVRVCVIKGCLIHLSGISYFANCVILATAKVFNEITRTQKLLTQAFMLLRPLLHEIFCFCCHQKESLLRNAVNILITACWHLD